MRLPIKRPELAPSTALRQSDHGHYLLPKNQKYTSSQKIALGSLIITRRYYAALEFDFPASGEGFLVFPGVDFLRVALRLPAVLGAVPVGVFFGTGLFAPVFWLVRALAASRCALVGGGRRREDRGRVTSKGGRKSPDSKR